MYRVHQDHKLHRSTSSFPTLYRIVYMHFHETSVPVLVPTYQFSPLLENLHDYSPLSNGPRRARPLRIFRDYGYPCKTNPSSLVSIVALAVLSHYPQYIHIARGQKYRESAREIQNIQNLSTKSRPPTKLYLPSIDTRISASSFPGSLGQLTEPFLPLKL